MNDTRSALTAILLGGLVAGTLDIGAASLISGKDPGFIMQFIASGLIGKSSFTGGAATIALGFVLQNLMGLIIAAVFVFASLRLPILRRQWLASGLAYGAVIYVVMNYVVLPLSAVGRSPSFSVEGLVKNGLAMLAFGVIVAWFAREKTPALATA